MKVVVIHMNQMLSWILELSLQISVENHRSLRLVVNQVLKNYQYLVNLRDQMKVVCPVVNHMNQMLNLKFVLTHKNQKLVLN